MQFSLIVTAVLYFTTLMNLVQATNGPVNNCPCSAFSNTKVRHSQIKEYKIQKEGICKFIAIVFEGVNGRKICSDPNNEWAKHVIRQLEKRRNEKISSPLEPTSTTAPSIPTSLPGLEPTLSPSTKTSTSSTTPALTPSATTLTSISAKSTPNPTNPASPSAPPNNIDVASASKVANDWAPATSPKTRKASARRRQKTKRRQNKRKMKKWQKRCTKTSK